MKWSAGTAMSQLSFLRWCPAASSAFHEFTKHTTDHKGGVSVFNVHAHLQLTSEPDGLQLIQKPTMMAMGLSVNICLSNVFSE